MSLLWDTIITVTIMAMDITVQSSPIQWLTPNRLSSLPPLRRRRRRMFFLLPLKLFCCQYLLRCQIPSLNRSKESQYIFGDCNKFHFMPNLSVSYSCWQCCLVFFVMLAPFVSPYDLLPAGKGIAGKGIAWIPRATVAVAVKCSVTSISFATKSPTY